MVTAVTIYIDDDKEIEGIRLRPLAAKLASDAPPRPLADGTSNATATATFQNNQTDVNADITYDL